MLLSKIKTELENFLESGYKIVINTDIKNFDNKFSDVDDVENFQFIVNVYNQDFINAVKAVKTETESDNKMMTKKLSVSTANAFYKDEVNKLKAIFVLAVTQTVIIKNI